MMAMSNAMCSHRKRIREKETRDDQKDKEIRKMKVPKGSFVALHVRTRTLHHTLQHMM